MAERSEDKTSAVLITPMSDESLRLLAELGREMNAISDRQELLDFVLTRLLQILRARSGSIFLVDDRSGELVIAAARGQNANELLGLRQKLGHGISGRAAKTREPILVTDIETDERFRGHQKKQGRYSTASFLSVPLLAQDRIIGVMNISEKDSHEPFTESDLQLLLVMVHQAASAILVATTVEELRQKNEALQGEVSGATRDLRLANHQLAELKRFNESIISSIPHGLVAFDRFYKVLFANPPARSMLELPAGTAESTPVCDWQTADDHEAWRDELSGMLHGGQAAQLERVVFVLPSGGQLVAHVHVNPLLGEDKRIFGGLLAIENLESRLQIEERLKNSERLAVLGRLAAKVAHELNTPLDGVKRFISLAQRVEAGNNGLRDYLQNAATGLDRMSEIISSLLRFARSAHHRFGQVQIGALLREAISVTDHLRAERNLRLVTHLDETLPLTNYTNLTSVFANLIKNAYDAMERGGTLEVSSGCAEDRIFIRFADNGCGIPAPFLPRIFDPFFTTKEVGKGTGLGLAICKDIVETYEGEVTVQSEEGKGSIFTVLLPMPGELAARAAPQLLTADPASKTSS